MQEINGFKVNDSVFDALSFKQAPVKKGDSLDRGDFLKLLMAQMENQDPLSPAQGTEFVSQLAQFSTLQGVQDLNDNFLSMSGSLKSSQAIQASALVGHMVFVDTDKARLSTSGEIFGSVRVDAPTENTALNIYNSQGMLVRQEVMGALDEGDVQFAWDGRDASGQSLPAGIYRFEAIGLRDGESVGLKTTMGANVNSVTIGATGELTLNVDGVGPLGIADVKEIL